MRSASGLPPKLQMVYTRHPTLGLMPAVPCPFYCWQFWKWQKVRCCSCGEEFVSRDLGLMPREYEAHYALNHGAPVESK